MTNPWDLNPELDTPETYPYFRAYLEARKGTRKLGVIRLSVWKHGARDPITLAEITRHYIAGKWKERAMAYDAHLAAIHDEERATLERQTAADISLSHRNALDLLSAVVTGELEKLAALSSKDDAAEIPGNLLKGLDSLIKNGRLIHGQATERVDYSGLTDEELEFRFQELKKAEENKDK